MKYDPIKNIFARFVGTSVFRRTLFYKLLGLMFLREWYVKRELRSLMRRNPPPRNILDAGCGFGQYTYYYATRAPNASIHAVDVKEDQVADCRVFFRNANISNVSFEVEDLTQSKRRNEFDLALSVDVMEHIADDVTVFRNLYNALRPGGILLVNTPSNLGGSDVRSEDETSFIEEHARSGYGVEEIRNKLESTGFAVEKIKFTYGRWGSVAWRLGIKIPMVMLNRSKILFLVLPFYYILTLPVTLLLMYLDYTADNKKGTGLIVVARKK